VLEEVKQTIKDWRNKAPVAAVIVEARPHCANLTDLFSRSRARAATTTPRPPSSRACAT